MPLVQAKCTNCGAALNVDDSKEAMVCQFCGEAFIVEKAINNYNITNNIQASVVNIYGGTSDFEIQAGELIKYTGASVNVTIPDTVKIIGKGAFQSLSIESVVIPNSVTHIGSYAFSYCTNLKEIAIPNSVTSIGDCAFDGTPWLEFQRKENPLVIVNNTLIDGHNCTGEINIPESVTIIGFEAFNNCTSITSINIQNNNLEYIRDKAFSNCTNLLSVTIPRSVKYIGEEAFKKCSSLTNITIPNRVTTINKSTFEECRSLKSVTIPNGVTIIGVEAFRSCISLKSVTIPNSVTTIGFRAFYDCKVLTSASIPETATVACDAFDGCSIKKSEGCYVATCVYGSYNCPQVWTLRRYRDNTLAKTWYGRAFIHTYYAVSPTIVKWFGNTKWFKKMWKGKLDRMVADLQSKGVESTPYIDKNW